MVRNLLNIMNVEYVDETKTITNDVNEMYDILGIEATRQNLIDQMIDLFEEYINDRHIELLSDIMTSRGILISIDRHGINRGDIGPLAKCSFEDTTDQLIKADIFGERDKLQGVSSNIMMGQTIPCGTGICDLLLDENKMIKELTEMNQEDDEYEVDENNIDVLIEDDINDDSSSR